MTQGLTVWLTGLSGAGKSTVASGLAERLTAEGKSPIILDGDLLRTGLNSDLSFSEMDRNEAVRRTGEVALLLNGLGGHVVISSLISPLRAARDAVRSRHRQADVDFVEVYIAASLEVCESRDTKDLYAKARRGEVKAMTGIGSPYEAPLSPEVVLETGSQSVDETLDQIEAFVLSRLR
jgi:adenylyl-sulfate kinase